MRLARYAPLVLLLALAAPARAQGAGVRAADLFQLREFGDVALSPDGRLVAYTLRETVPDPQRENRHTSRTHVWLAPLDGSAPPRALTRGDQGASGPVWHPGGESLAFVRTSGGRAQVHLLPLGGGEAYPVTGLPRGAGSPQFSPDGRSLLVAQALTRAGVDSLGVAPWPRGGSGPAPEPLAEGVRPDPDGTPAQVRAWLARQDAAVVTPTTRLDFQGEFGLQTELAFRHLYVVDLAEASPDRVPSARALTRGFQATGGGAWTRDGRHVVYAASADTLLFPDEARQAALYRIEAGGGRPERLLALDGHTLGGPVPLADGRVLFTGSRLADEGFAEGQIGVFDGRTGQARWLTDAFDRSAGQVTVSPDGRYAYFVASEDGGFPLYRLDLSARAPRPERLTGLETGVRAFDVGPQGAAWVQTSPADPFVLYAGDARAGRARLLHAPNAAWIGERALSPPQHRTLPITIPTPEGGTRRVEMDYWVVEPAGRRPGERYPVVLQIHGGPSAMWGPGEASMWHEFQTFAARGFGVVYANPRGSGGYGLDFRRANYRDWGPGPASDVLGALEAALAANDWMDGERLTVTGGSYAGYLVAWIVSQDGRFKAAAAQRGVYDLPTFFGEGNAWRLVPTHFGGFPWEPETAAVLRQQSPLTHAANIHTPLLIKHGSQDLRTGVIQSEVLYRTLRVLGRPVEYARYPGAGHDLSRMGDPDQRLDRLVRIAEFLERHVR